ncbi:uncharacterized protein LOC134059660 [Sardina pilchardus]|uniref:uncharacterized protein LOC134059660 n=1 Tax=Sardina pilchardus TaxID=27697 RepID=UPI002E165421
MTPQTTLSLILLLLLLISAEELHQPDSVLLVSPGEKATLRCVHSHRYVYLYWIKQTAGHKLQHVAFKQKYAKPKMCAEFEESSRFDVEDVNGVFYLNISDVQSLDAYLYYCVQVYTDRLEFAGGTQLLLNGTDSLQDNRTAPQEPLSSSVPLPVLVSALGVSVVVSLILMLLLIRATRGTRAAEVTSSPVTQAEEDPEAVNYVALDFRAQKPRAAQRHSNSERNTLYSPLSLSLSHTHTHTHTHTQRHSNSERNTLYSPLTHTHTHRERGTLNDEL